ncbi:MAG: DNA cytosine methyltransferase [Vampirovibrionales bacterium]
MILRVASLFSGCGGLDLGFEGNFTLPYRCNLPASWIEAQTQHTMKLKPTDFKTVFACDIKPSAKLAWESFFKTPNVFELESLVTLVKQAHAGLYTFPQVDVVTGGFPCQDFSVSGKRKGFHSVRSHLNHVHQDLPTEETRGMLYYWMREAIALMNPAMFVAENVKGLVSLGDAQHIITQDFRTINGGYLVLEPKILHAAHYGVPQSRERVIFIGIRQDLLSQIQLQHLQQGTLSLYPEALATEAEAFITCEKALATLEEPALSLDPSQKAYSKAKWYGKHCQGQTEIQWRGIAPTIRSEHHGNIEFRRLSRDHGGSIDTEYHLPERRLTVRECARLQTFPDEYAFVQPGLSASEAYKLIGNAVPPLLAYHLARHLQEIWRELNLPVVGRLKEVA